VTGVERAAAIDRLESALRADEADEKDVHIRQAIQLVRLADQTERGDEADS